MYRNIKQIIIFIGGIFLYQCSVEPEEQNQPKWIDVSINESYYDYGEYDVEADIVINFTNVNLSKIDILSIKFDINFSYPPNNLYIESYDGNLSYSGEQNQYGINLYVQDYSPILDPDNSLSVDISYQFNTEDVESIQLCIENLQIMNENSIEYDIRFMDHCTIL